jgi:hypothetical protein
LNALIGLIIVTAVSTLAYRYYYYGDADEITKFLCEAFPVVTDKYGECMKHYKQPSR